MRQCEFGDDLRELRPGQTAVVVVSNGPVTITATGEPLQAAQPEPRRAA